MKDENDVTKFSDYRYRPELDKETSDKITELRKKLNVENLPLNSVTNMFLKIGMNCVEKSIDSMKAELIKKAKDNFPHLMDILNT